MEKIPDKEKIVPLERISEKEEKEILENLQKNLGGDFNFDYTEEDIKNCQDKEFFIIKTKDRKCEDQEERKEVYHHFPKRKKIYDPELGLIKIEDAIEATIKYYSQISSKEKAPTKAVIQKLQEERNKNKKEKKEK